ncbi:MAG: hypothetical protein ACRDRL_23380 [Sciscionella sp.]
MTEQSPHASQSAVMLDIGGDIGALVLYTDAADDDAEIEISPGIDPQAPRTHNQVHPRRSRAGTLYCAVYPSLTAGRYTLWRDAVTAEVTLTIRGGEITEHTLSAPLGRCGGLQHPHSHPGDHPHSDDHVHDRDEEHSRHD